MYQVANIARSKGDPKIVRSGTSSVGSSDRMARALGWFSIGLGVAEIFAARRFTRALGMPGKEGMFRAFGAREISSGILSLSIDKQAGLWSRVAGDGIDVATLAAGLGRNNPRRNNVALALAAVASVTLLDIACAKSLGTRHARKPARIRDYRDRSGFPRGIEASRGVAALDRQKPMQAIAAE